jgi:uncharacterized membrane protein YkoI
MARTIDKLVLGILVVMLIGMGAVFISALDNGKVIQYSAERESQVQVSDITPDEAKAAALMSVSGTIEDVELTRYNGQKAYEVEVKDGSMTKDVILDMNGNVIKIETTEENEAVDVPISGNALDRASQAALDYIGQGRVTDSEIGDEEGYYEIEITLENGDEVDVHLDENFNVLSTEY